MKKLIRELYIKNLKKLGLLKELLGKEVVAIADVGATGGIDKAWFGSNEIIKIYSFDPDNRAILEDKNSISFPTALWDQNQAVKLHLTKFPPASSLKEPNIKELLPFPNSSAHRVLGTKSLNAITMEEALKSHQKPDFIKVDAEGADLEILNGARNFLAKDCFGVQVETQFIERNKGSALFGEIDNFLRSYNFRLLTIKREFWRRNNSKWGANSQTQIIWADAFYIKDTDKLIDEMKCQKCQQREISLTKFSFICVILGAHDYLYDALSNVRKEKIVDSKTLDKLEAFLDANIEKPINAFINRVALLLLAIFIYFFSFLLYKEKQNAKRLLRYATKRFLMTCLLTISRSGITSERIGAEYNKNVINDFL